MSPQRIFARVDRDDFIGRDAELRELLRRVQSYENEEKILVLGEPRAGTSEFLRQACDELFMRRADAVPVYFAFGGDGVSLSETAVDFFRSFLQQYIAYRRVDPSLANSSLTLHELSELALPTDYEAVNTLLEAFERERASANESSLLEFCFNAPRRLATDTRRSFFPMLDCVGLASQEKQHITLAAAAVNAFSRGDQRVAFAGLRRHLLDLFHSTAGTGQSPEIIHLDALSEDEALRLLDKLTQRLGIDTNRQTRDLIVQQIGGSPLFITAMAQAAYESKTPLTSFLECQKLYVNELLGGRIYRHFSNLLDQITPQAQTRRTLLRVLYESGLSDSGKASLWTWKKRLGLDAAEFERVIDSLHVHELANSSRSVVEVNREALVWMDYLHAQYRLEVSGETRALVVANTLLETLKRAPQAMARKYRREAALGLDEILIRFNCQEVPASLLHYDSFAAAHTGVDTDDVNAALDSEADLVRLPQVIHVADCASLSLSIRTEEKRCAIAHGFEAADYTNESEIAWIAAEIDSKLEASRDLTKEWCDRLTHIAHEANIGRFRLWLVSPEGFSDEASALLREREAYSSSRRQVELLAARLAPGEAKQPDAAVNEYEMVIPMSTDTELIAAHTVEQIARRVNFRPDAINQIKLALVEACINAAEHSLSPDRKIYQRFRVENDKLVVIVASRGVVPANISGNGGANGEGKSRRGWGLKLIRTLMDEVEFERVDDGTQLRMTKYIK